MIQGRIIFQEGGNDMILVSKEWTNDYGACLSGDDNDLKTKSSLILQSQESQQVKVKVNQMVNGQRSIKSISKGLNQGLDETLVIRIDYLSTIPNPIGKLKSD